MKARWFVIFVAVAAVAVAIVVSSVGGGDSGGGTGAPKNALRVSFAYSPGEGGAARAADPALQRRARKVDGKPVFVEGTGGQLGRRRDRASPAGS